MRQSYQSTSHNPIIVWIRSRYTDEILALFVRFR